MSYKVCTIISYFSIFSVAINLVRVDFVLVVASEPMTFEKAKVSTPVCLPAEEIRLIPLIPYAKTELCLVTDPQVAEHCYSTTH